MSRPRNPAPDAQIVATGIPTATASAPEIPAELEELKACPRCDGIAVAAKDKHGLWRCACKDCGYWDNMVAYTEAQARASWQGCGDPLAVE